MARTRLSRWIALSAGAVVLLVVLIAAFSGGSGKSDGHAAEVAAKTAAPAAEISPAAPMEITRIAPPPLPFADKQ